MTLAVRGEGNAARLNQNPVFPRVLQEPPAGDLCVARFSGEFAEIKLDVDSELHLLPGELPFAWKIPAGFRRIRSGCGLHLFESRSKSPPFAGQSAMSQRWYYQLFGEEFGPVTEPQVLHLLEDGTLSPDDQIRPESSQNWVAISQSFPGTANGTMDEIADLSELAFSFEDSGPTARRSTYAVDEVSSTGPIQPIQPARGVMPTAPEISNDGPSYYCQSFGETLGPMTVADLIGMADTGSLHKSDLVRCGLEGEWVPAGDIRELDLVMALLRAERVTEEAAPMSATMEKRIGAAAVAGLTAANELVEPPVGQPVVKPESEQTTQSRAGGRAAEPAVSDAAAPVRKKGKKRKGKKDDDELIDEIFDDVFAEEEEPVKPARAAYSAPIGTAVEPKPPTPSYSSAPISPAAPSVSAIAANLAASSAASRPSGARLSSPGATLSSKKSSGGGMSFDFQGPGILVIVALVLIMAGGGYVYQYGMPSFSLFSASPEEYPNRVKAAIEEYKALGAEPSERQWSIFANSTRSEFMAYYKNSISGGAVTDPKTVACLQAMKTLLNLAAIGFNDKSGRDKMFEKLEKQALEMDK